MNPSTAGNSSKRQTWRAVWRGVWMGAVLPAMLALLILGLDLLTILVDWSVWESGEWGVLFLMAVALLVVTLPPAVLGGGINAWILYRLISYRGGVSDWSAMSIGVLLGVLAGVIAVGIAYLMTEDWELSATTWGGVLAICAVVGGIHGWLTVRYLRRHTSSALG